MLFRRRYLFFSPQIHNCRIAVQIIANYTFPSTSSFCELILFLCLIVSNKLLCSDLRSLEVTDPRIVLSFVCCNVHHANARKLVQLDRCWAWKSCHSKFCMNSSVVLWDRCIAELSSSIMWRVQHTTILFVYKRWRHKELTLRHWITILLLAH